MEEKSLPREGLGEDENMELWYCGCDWLLP